MEDNKSMMQYPRANASNQHPRQASNMRYRNRVIPLYKMTAEQRMWATQDTNKQYKIRKEFRPRPEKILSSKERKRIKWMSKMNKLQKDNNNLLSKPKLVNSLEKIFNRHQTEQMLPNGAAVKKEDGEPRTALIGKGIPMSEVAERISADKKGKSQSKFQNRLSKGTADGGISKSTDKSLKEDAFPVSEKDVELRKTFIRKGSTMNEQKLARKNRKRKQSGPKQLGFISESTSAEDKLMMEVKIKKPIPTMEIDEQSINLHVGGVTVKKKKTGKSVKKVQQTLEINGKVGDAVYVDGVPVRGKDGESLTGLRRALIGTSMNEVGTKCKSKLARKRNRRKQLRSNQLGEENEDREVNLMSESIKKATKADKKKSENEVKQKQSIREGETLEIDGKLVDVVYVDGFQVKKKDGVQIAELRKVLIKNGFPMSEVEASVGLAARCAGKMLADAMEKASSKCKQAGDIFETPEENVNGSNRLEHTLKQRAWYPKAELQPSGL